MGGTKLFEDMWDLKLYLTGIFSQEVTGDMLYSSKEINPERERCECMKKGGNSELQEKQKVAQERKDSLSALSGLVARTFRES